MRSPRPLRRLPSARRDHRRAACRRCGAEETTAEAEEEIRELKKQLQEAKGREDALLEVINRCRWGESAERGGNVLGRAMRASLLRWFEPAFSTINVDIYILNIYFLHQTASQHYWGAEGALGPS